MNLINTLSGKLKQFKKCFFKDNSAAVSFDEINKYSDSIAHYILQQIDEESLVIISGVNSTKFVISYLGALKSERIILLLPSLKLLNIYLTYIKYFHSCLIITDETDLSQIAVLEQSGTKYKILPINSTEFNSNAYRERKAVHCCKEDSDTIVLLTTGGTTGIPKLVELTNSNLLSNLNQIQKVLKGKFLGHNLISVLPFFHAFGLLAGIHFPIFFGINAYIKSDFAIKDFLNTIIEDNIEICFFVPQIIKIINKTLYHDKNVRLPLKLCISGSDKLDIGDYETFRNFTQASIVEGYGLTECSPVTHLNPIDNPKPSSIGHPLPQTECKIINGELFIKGPQVMKGYFANREETANVFIDDFLKTGDIAEIDSEGYFYIKGRLKEVIKYGGESIFPYSIEKSILKLEGVNEVAVVAKEDSKYGQIPIAFVVKKENSKICEDDINKHFAKELPANLRPRKIIFLDSLPKTPLGKIKKFTLQQLANTSIFP